MQNEDSGLYILGIRITDYFYSYSSQLKNIIKHQ